MAVTDSCLIIGASSDMAMALMQRMPSGQKILAHYSEGNDAFEKICQERSADIQKIKADLNSEVSLQQMLDAIDASNMPNKIVHFAAPRVSHKRFKDLQWQDIEQQLNVGLRSAMAVIQHCLPAMSKAKQGSIVLVLSSYINDKPPKALTDYVTAKYALKGLMDCLVSEYADKGIRINAVSPSMVETAFLNDIDEKFVELAAHQHPLKRNALVEDVVPSIEFLLSDDSRYINGADIAITGGS